MLHGSATTMFHLLHARSTSPDDDVIRIPALGEPPWVFGRFLDRPPTALPLRYRLADDYRGSTRPLYAAPYPLIRTDLLSLLEQGGADNFQCWDAVLEQPGLRMEHADFRAFNVVGLIATSTEAAAVMQQHQDLELSVGDRTGQLLHHDRLPATLACFRLAERVGALVVGPQIKALLDQARLPNLALEPLA